MDAAIAAFESDDAKKEVKRLRRQVADQELLLQRAQQQQDELQAKVTALEDRAMHMDGTGVARDSVDGSEVIAAEVAADIGSLATSLQAQRDTLARAEAVRSRAVANPNLQYDSATQAFYDSERGFWYDAVTTLYFDPSSSCYYQLDVDAREFVYHSTRIAPAASAATADDPDSPQLILRLVVDRSSVFDKGDVLAVAEGGMVGRDDDADLQIDDSEVSSRHAEIRRDPKGFFYVRDLGSRNGTFLNDRRLSKAKKSSDDFELRSGDVIEIGRDTVMRVHIHRPSDRCEECRLQPAPHVMSSTPMAYDISLPLVEEEGKGHETSRHTDEDKEVLRRRELSRLKRKYKAFGDAEPVIPDNMRDRSAARRETVGSTVPSASAGRPPLATSAPAGSYEHTSSLDKPLNESNKGFRLLQKAGWKAGEGLGRDGAGRTEPVNIKQTDTRSGLGQKPAPTSNWARTVQRYAALEEKDAGGKA
eukprot:m.83021 g.83021  ORF g.83021 m.83021 type:complete len:476 (+) comp14951_c0_seq1:146-1573(+)